MCICVYSAYVCIRARTCVYLCLLVYANIDVLEYLFVNFYAWYNCLDRCVLVYFCKPVYTCAYPCKLVNARQY